MFRIKIECDACGERYGVDGQNQTDANRSWVNDANGTVRGNRHVCGDCTRSGNEPLNRCAYCETRIRPPHLTTLVGDFCDEQCRSRWRASQ